MAFNIAETQEITSNLGIVGPATSYLIAFNPTEEQRKELGLPDKKYIKIVEEMNDLNLPVQYKQFSFIFYVKINPDVITALGEKANFLKSKVFPIIYNITDKPAKWGTADPSGRWEADQIKAIHKSGNTWNFDQGRPYKTSDKDCYALLHGEENLLEFFKILVNYPTNKDGQEEWQAAGKVLSITGDDLKERGHVLRRYFEGDFSDFKTHIDNRIKGSSFEGSKVPFQMMFRYYVNNGYNVAHNKPEFPQSRRIDILEESFLRLVKDKTNLEKIKDYKYDYRKMNAEMCNYNTKKTFENGILNCGVYSPSIVDMQSSIVAKEEQSKPEIHQSGVINDFPTVENDDLPF